MRISTYVPGLGSVLLTLAALLGACSDGRDESAFGSGVPTSGGDGAVTDGQTSSTGDDDDGGEQGGDGDGTDDGDTDGSDGDDDGDHVFDVGGDGDGDSGDGESGCTKIDFLFVIDNSQSMEAEQQNLVSSFPGFIDTIEAATNAQDYHIMVADPDWDPSLWSCAKKCQVLDQPTCKYDDSIVCADFEEAGAYSCEDSIGVGVVEAPDGQSCGVVGAQPYVVDGQPDLADTFACMATVGIAGDNTEHVMDSMRFAVSDEFNDQGGCQEGFLREDAILVVTFITDEVPVYSLGGPGDWKTALVDAKGGNEDAVVVLGLVGDSGLQNGICQPKNGELGADDTPSLRNFVDSFGEHGSWGSVCAEDYSPFFQDAVSVIETVCEDFVPEG